jgi:hypothetical protein
MNITETVQNLPTYKEDFKKDPQWLRHETEHYIFYYFSQTFAEKEIGQISEIQEKAFKKIIEFLEVSVPKRKITYYLYPNPEIKKKLMGDDWYAQAIRKDFIVHVLYTEEIKPVGEHEDTHLLSLPWGLSIAFFQEGLAEYMVGHGWHGEDHDKLAYEALKKDFLPTVESMMDHVKWKELDDDHALYYYCFVGSFTKFLIEQYGKVKFKMLYQNTDRLKTKEENNRIFQNIYDISSNEAEKEWKKHLINVPFNSMNA